jgi:hypothetical protein
MKVIKMLQDKLLGLSLKGDYVIATLKLDKGVVEGRLTKGLQQSSCERYLKI